MQPVTPQVILEFTPGTSIEVVCHKCGISDDEMHSAMYATTEKSLLSMVCNYQQMLHILSQLGLQQCGVVFLHSQTILFPGGLVLSAGDIVKHFGWTAESFKHKLVWFGWAEDAVASQEWIGSPPGELLSVSVAMAQLKANQEAKLSHSSIEAKPEPIKDKASF